MTDNKERFAGFVLLVLYAASLVIFSYRQGLTAYSKILGVLIIAFFGAAIIRRMNRSVFPLEFAAVFAWFMWAVLASIFANDIDMAVKKVMTLTQVLLVSFVFCSVLVWQKKTMPFWVTFAIIAVIASAITLNDLASFTDPKSGRISGTTGNANSFGFVLIIGFVPSLVGCLTSKRWIAKVFLLALALFLFYMIAQTGSRKAMIASVIVMLMIFGIFAAHIKQHGGPKVVAFVGFSLLLLGGGVYFLSSSEYAYRVEAVVMAAESGNVSEGGRSLDKRTNFYETAMEHTLENPIVGIGLDNFRLLRDDLGVTSIDQYAHSNYAEIGVSTGIPGLLLYVSIYVIMVIRIISSRRCISSDELVGPYCIGVAVVFTIIAYDFAMVSYYQKLSWLVTAAAIAQVELLRRHSVSSSSKLTPEAHLLV